MNAVVQQEEPSSVITEIVPEATPMQLVAQAMKAGNMELVERFMALQARWEAAQAKKAYIVAFSQFKRNMPDVIKDMLNKQYDSDYSSLANLVNTVSKVMAEYELHHQWTPVVNGNVVTMTCIVTHSGGHSESVTIPGPTDTSGAKNPLQQIKSALTYLEGATFQAITGVVARSASKDDDGNGAGKKQEEVTVPEGYDNWRADMTALADEGTEKLQAAWTASKQDFRRHVVKHDELWWNATKKKATKVQSATVTP